eukprot:3781775-Ditylum_brightwellii.AAC.1
MEFLRKGGNLNSSITMNNITLWSRGNTGVTTTAPTTKATTPIRLLPADFPIFSGEIEDQETYKTKAGAQIGQMAFKFLLTRDPISPEEKERDKELFN